MRRSTAVLLTALLLLSACSSSPPSPLPSQSPAEDALTVCAVKCGKADAFVLYCGGHAMLLDAGETDDADKILSVLDDLKVDSIDVLLISHFDKDHIGGAAQLISSVGIGKVIEPVYKEKSDEMKAYRLALGQSDAEIVRAEKELSFGLGSAWVTIYPTSLDDPGDNDVSLIVSVTHGELDFLFPGDAEEARLREWMSGHDESYDFLKAPHHGRWNDASGDFYTQTRPRVCVITASEKNPADERVLELLESLGTEIYLTQEGNAVFESDGKTLRASQVNPKK